MENKIMDRIIDGRRCRLLNTWAHRKYPYWVADSGDYVAYSDAAGGFYCPCRIFCDYGGPFIVERNNGTNIEKKYLESLVLESFYPSPSFD